jgi:hypothetical protein
MANGKNASSHLLSLDGIIMQGHSFFYDTTQCLLAAMVV